jgi:hypothetical protein
MPSRTTLVSRIKSSNQQKDKKNKYLENCLQQLCAFTPFVISIDGQSGYEAKNLLKRLALHLAEKWQKPYSVTCGLVKSRISLACVRATHQVSEVLEPPSAQLAVKYNGKMEQELASIESINKSPNDRSTLNFNYNVKTTMEDTSDVSQQPPFSTHTHWQIQTSSQQHNRTDSHS